MTDIDENHLYNINTLPHYYLTTYEDGPSLYFESDLSKGEFMEICNVLNEMFKHKLVFLPDQISDGGLKIQLANTPQNKNFIYKSMRFQVNDWPWIDNVEDWYNNDETLFHKGKKIYTFLRASGAPCWTGKEVLAIRAAMYRYNVILENK